MRLFDEDRIGCYLDHIGHRVEKASDGEPRAMIDLTLRVQPFTPELAGAFDPDVRALLFTLSDATPKPKIKSLAFKLTIPRQLIEICAAPDVTLGSLALSEVEISDVRARTEKGVDGYALVFAASFEHTNSAELEYVCDWLTGQRFLTFTSQQRTLDFEAAGARG